MSAVVRNQIHSENHVQNYSSMRESIHQRALEVSAQYKKSESDLMEVLEQVENHKVYLHLGRSSLFQYGVQDLGLAENVIYNLITVMRKARAIPQLKTEIQEGNLTLSNARKIVPILTLENQNEWIKKASELTQRQLEKEVVKLRPMSATPERATYVTESRIKLVLGLPEKEMMKLRKVQDLVSQSTAIHASLEDSLVEMMDFYLKHKDPVAKAKRVYVKKGLVQSEKKAVATNQLVSIQASNAKANKREPIAASILHQVNLRDQRRCTHLNSRNERCNQSRWIEIHHKLPVSQGGKNTLENLITLCSTHHDWIHQQSSHYE